MARTLAASLVAALAVCVAWLSLEDPRLVRDALAIAALAVCPALVRRRPARVVALVLTVFGAAWVTFGAQPWELLPFRDERVLAPMLRDTGTGIVDFYAVFLPFDSALNPEMHMLVLSAIFGFTVGASLLVAARRPIGAAAVTVAGVGWPATLGGGSALAFGTLALVAALAIPLVLRAGSLRAVLAGTAIGALVVVAAAGASSATTLGRSPALDWESWDLRGPARQASAVKLVWNADYDGISFPPEKTIVLKIDGPESPHYWRATTLDLFSTNANWQEDFYLNGPIDQRSRAINALGPIDFRSREGNTPLVPRRASNPKTWLEQRVRIEALVDDHLVAAGTPVGLEAQSVGTVFLQARDVLRAGDPVLAGKSYRVWSYAPNPSPRSLSAARARLPASLSLFLKIDGRQYPSFATANRDLVMRRFLSDPSYAGYTWHKTMYEVARRIAGKAETPYAAVLALESWFRQTGGFTYDETPPALSPVQGPPLVAFVTSTKAGYCQHFAGAMALMLRMLGVPARVAEGYTSGTNEDGTWVVTDHDAHAWVEVWFAGLGWIPFDPTPGRGTLSGDYSFASASEEAVAALRRGDLKGSAPVTRSRAPDTSDLLPTATSSPERAPWLIGTGLVLASAWIVLVGVGKAIHRRARYRSRDPRRIATASRQELEGFLRDQGALVGRNATLADLQQAVRQELGLDCRVFTAAVARARFGPPGTVEQGATTARVELRRLLRSARDGLSFWARFRGFVSVRSLRSMRAS